MSDGTAPPNLPPNLAGPAWGGQRLYTLEYPVISPLTFRPTSRVRTTPFALSWVGEGGRMLLVFRGTVWREVRRRKE